MILGQKLINFFVGFLRHPKFHSELNWPLTNSFYLNDPLISVARPRTIFCTKGNRKSKLTFRRPKKPFSIGGSQIYRLFLPLHKPENSTYLEKIYNLLLFTILSFIYKLMVNIKLKFKIRNFIWWAKH